MKNQENNHRRRWLPYGAALVFLGLLIAGLWPRPVAVETAIVTEGPLRNYIQDEGKTRIRQRFLISTPVGGQLRRISFKAGATIESQGQILAMIDPVSPALLDQRTRSLAEARRETAMAQLEKAKAKFSFGKKELDRAERLHEARTLSSQELEQAQWRETAASRELTEAESALKQAETELLEFTASTNGHRASVEVCSPVSGKVLKVFEESSRVVASGTPLLEIGDPTDLEVLIEVLSKDAAGIAPGAAVELDQWGGPEPLKAVVRHVEPAAFTKVSALGVEEQRVYVVADITTPPDKRANLGDQFRVEGRIITWETPKTLKVASGALFHRGDGWHAYVLRDGRTTLLNVKVGRSSALETQVLEGLQEGDELILYPSDRVKDGARANRVKI